MSLDLLNLNQNDKVRKILQKHTDGVLFDEMVCAVFAKIHTKNTQLTHIIMFFIQVLYSNHCIKINRKLKLQRRILVITDKAMYNFKKKSKLKRRISIECIHSISISVTSNDIVFHIPSSYDYLYRLHEKKDTLQIIQIAQESAFKFSHFINIFCFDLDDLSQISQNDKSKKKRNQSAEEYMKQRISGWKQKYKMEKIQNHHRGNSHPLQDQNKENFVDDDDAGGDLQQSQLSNGCLSFLPEGFCKTFTPQKSVSDSSFMFHVNCLHPQNESKFKSTERENNSIRIEWNVGSKLEVYSNSKQQWYEGQVDKVYIDSLGEWLSVVYDHGQTQKDLQRNDASLRPLHSQQQQQRAMC